MLRRIFVLSFLLSGAVFAFAQKNTITLDEAVQNASDKISEFLPPDGAVVEFYNRDFDVPENLKTVSEHIIHDLRYSLKEKDIYVVDTETLTDIKTRDMKRLGNEISEESVLGKVLMADQDGTPYKMKGSFHYQGKEHYSLIITIIDISKNLDGLDLPIRQTVRMDSKLADLLGIDWADTSWKDKRFWVGGWVGISPWSHRDIKLIPLSGLATGIQGKMVLGGWFALGAELGLQRVNYSEYDNFATVGTASALASFIISPGYTHFMAEPFAGVYYNFPNKNGNYSKSREDLTPFGAVTGVDLGGKLGSGVLFVDGRIGFWYEEPIIRFFSVGIGYKIGLPWTNSKDKQ